MAVSKQAQSLVDQAQALSKRFTDHRAALAQIHQNGLLSGEGRQQQAQQLVERHQGAVNAALTTMASSVGDMQARAAGQMRRAMAAPEGAREDAGRVLAPVLAVAHTNPGAVVAAYRRAVADGDIAKLGLLEDLAGSVSDALPSDTARRDFASRWQIAQAETRDQLPQAVRDAHDAQDEAQRVTGFAKAVTDLAGRESATPQGGGFLNPRMLDGVARSFGLLEDGGAVAGPTGPTVSPTGRAVIS